MKKNNVLFCLPVLILLLGCGEKRVTGTGSVDSLHSVQLRLASGRQEETNKKLVLDMYQELFGDKDVASIDKYIDEQYIQHNPILPDGRDTLKKAAAVWFKGASKEKIDVRHIAADDDLVFIHTRSARGKDVLSIIDIYRIENNKIVEHWDVIQAVPERSANPHPMF